MAGGNFHTSLRRVADLKLVESEYAVSGIFA